MAPLGDLIQQIAHRPLASLSIVLNLVLIESLLSIDNSAVLATLVLDLPPAERPKALRYGIIGAYAFRGLALFFASLLISIWWVKPLGGAYLLYLAIRFFRHYRKPQSSPAAEAKEQKKSWLYRRTLGAIGPFWATVVMVEVLDAAFSIDNVIAANAYSRNILLVWTGVFIGILAMRFVTGFFVKLMARFPFLETCAYLIISVLGVKLLLSGASHFLPCSRFALFMDGNTECLAARGLPQPTGEPPKTPGDMVMSALSLAVFILPLITSALFNKPAKRAP